MQTTTRPARVAKAGHRPTALWTAASRVQVRWRRAWMAVVATLVIVLTVVPASSVPPPLLDWAVAMNGTGGDTLTEMAVDGSGNVYTAGIVSGTTDFDPGPGTFNLTSAGGQDIFVSKLDSAGNFVWAVRMGDVGEDAAWGLAIDGSDNLYIAGSFEGTVDFDPGPGVFNLTSAGSQDVFVAKLDSAGNLVWAGRMGGSNRDQARELVVDASGNVYTTGFCRTSPDFDPGPGTFTLACTGDDIFVSKLDSAGNFVWAARMGSGGNSVDFGLSLAVDGSRNVYTTGFFQTTADFDPGPGVFNLTSAGQHDIFVSKLDSAGNFVWAARMGGPNTGDDGYSVAVDGSGNVYTTGTFNGTADFDPGPGTFNLTSAGLRDVFVSKLDSAGNFVWAAQMGGPGNDFGFELALDGADNVYTTGEFTGTADFDPGAGVFNLTAVGLTNIFVSRLDSAGNFVSAIGMGAFFTQGNGLVLDGSGNVHIGGHFRGSGDFDPGAGVFNLTALGVNQNVFVLKLVASNSAPSVAANNASVAAAEGAVAVNTGTFGDPDGDTVTLSSSIGSIVDTGGGTWSWSFGTSDGPAETQTVNITADDGNGGTAMTSFSLTVNNVAPTIDAVSVPSDPVAIGDQPISADATFSDPAGTADAAYTCTVDYGDDTGAQAGAATATTCAGPDHSYAEAGVYTVTVTVTDKDGGSDSAEATEFVVIFDPDSGFVTGGGRIDSPAGAYPADPDLVGIANFGFVSKYKKGATIPTGQTEFQFHAGDLNFHSSSYQWLVVNQGGTRAQFKGSGTINGDGHYQFLLWAVDGANAGDPDTFRIKIWTEDGGGGETVIYDNGTNQDIDGGNIVVHTKKKK